MDRLMAEAPAGNLARIGNEMIDGFECENKRRLDVMINRLGFFSAPVPETIEQLRHAVKGFEAGYQAASAGAQHFERFEPGPADENIKRARGLLQQGRQRQRPVLNFDDPEIFMLRAELTEAGIGEADAQILRRVLHAERQIHRIRHPTEKAQQFPLRQLADGGRLCAVIDSATGPGQAVRVMRHGATIARRVLFDANVAPLPGFERETGFVF